MKIVIFGGFVDYQIQMARAFNKKGESMVIIYALSDRLPEENARVMGDSLNLKILSRQGPLYNPMSFLKFLGNMYRIMGEIRKFKPDIVHFQVGAPMLALFMMLMPGMPIVTTFHDVMPHIGEEKAGEKRLHVYIRRRSDRLLVHGERLRQTMVEQYHVAPSKVCSIPIGPHNIDAFKLYEEPGLEDDGRTVMFFGRILEYKGLEYLIRAEPLITREIPDVKIVIAGAGDIEAYERQIVHKDRFEIYNHYVPYDEGARLFQQCSVVVLPYTEASQSGVVSTAYGFKKPVVVTDTGSIPEVVDHGKTGLIVPPGDPQAIADAVIRLLKDGKLRQDMGENAYKKLSTDLSWDRVVDKSMEVYGQVAEERGRASSGEHNGKGRVPARLET